MMKTNEANTNIFTGLIDFMSQLKMWYVIITTIIGGLLIALTILCLKDKRKRTLANQIPGPEGSFIIGNLLLFTQRPEIFIKNILKEYRM